MTDAAFAQQKPTLDPRVPELAREAMEALAQAWNEAPDRDCALSEWVKQEGSGILWRWGWHFPQEARRLADHAQSEQEQICAGFAVLGSWESAKVEPPLSFGMWTEWEGDSYHRMANVQWEFCAEAEARSFPPALVSCAKRALDALGEFVSMKEGWYDDNEGRREDCSAQEFLFERLPDARVNLAHRGFAPSTAALLAHAVIRQDLDESGLDAPAQSSKPRL